ncbi:ubiquitin-like protein-NEDD8-like protein RUB3 [Orbicella faveolata]|uniref:ubiquitin-like protein-NEDD8-like protein RUB3 n=1 Tax=Orbicella faveolata TaxID=48498 RepID=UPI0009E47227|nr:ubiquitin-like protein-NEDD8-like protein RUB3 [Orbicella faveolata]
MAPGQIQIFVHGIQGGITTVNIHKDATVKEFFAVVSKKNGVPEDQLRAVYTTKQLEIGKRLSDYGMQNESNVFLILRLLGGSMTSIPPEKELDDAVELSDAPDMITWDDDPGNKRAKMPCGHAISKEVSFSLSFSFPSPISPLFPLTPRLSCSIKSTLPLSIMSV